MANDDHIAQLMKGVAAWNVWRDENPNIRPDLSGANLNGANLSGAKLSEANLSGAHINGAHLNGANLNGAYLLGAALVETDLRDADLTGCHIYGTSAWSLKLERTKQQNLVITRENNPIGDIFCNLSKFLAQMFKFI